MSASKHVVLIGRPNVGKSSLFNRLVGRDEAIVSAEAHSTRDVRHGKVRGRFPYRISDLGGIGEMNEGTAELKELSALAMERAWSEAEAADLAILVLDVHEFLPEDRILLERLRKGNISFIAVANKTDLAADENLLGEFHEAGLLDIVAISCKNGRNLEKLTSLVIQKLKGSSQAPLPPEDSEPVEASDNSENPDAILAILGRPNAGKSSLLNAFLQRDRALVSPIAGTTRDTVSDDLFVRGSRIRILDTAGLRKKSSDKGLVEEASVDKTLHAIRGSDGVILVIDAKEGLAEQDKKIASVAVHHQKSLILAVNKWDLIHDKSWKDYEDRIRYLFPHIHHIEVLPVSAKSGKNVRKILETMVTLMGNRGRSLRTPEFNRVLEKLVRERPPAVTRWGNLKVFYGVQIREEPPVFRIFVNDKKRLRDNYAKYLENALRRDLKLGGNPLIIDFASRGEGKKVRGNATGAPQAETRQEKAERKKIGRRSGGQAVIKTRKEVKGKIK